MSLRLRLALYLLALHAVLAAGAWALFRGEPAALVAAEAGLVASAAVGALLVRSLTAVDALADASADLLRDGAFGLRLRPGGPPAGRRLAETFNALAAHLHAERVRLEEQQLLLDKILRAAPVGVFLADFDGRVTFANAAAAAFVGGPDPLGRPLDALPDPFGPLLAAPFEGARSLTRPDGRRLRVVRGTYLDRGHPRAFVLVEELTEELRRSEKAAYERLVRLVAHEVGNTTAAVASVLEALPAVAPGLDADVVRALDAARARAHGLADFVRRLADVARLPDPVRADTDLAGLARSVAAAMGPGAERAGVALRVEAAGAGPVVALDRVQMEQVLVNVVKNAVEAAGAGGAVTLRVRPAGPTLEVEDDAGALTSEARAHLFTPFYTTKPDGQGLGLTLAREVLDRHGFAFALDGEPGRFTRFTIRFG